MARRDPLEYTVRVELARSTLLSSQTATEALGTEEMERRIEENTEQLQEAQQDQRTELERNMEREWQDLLSTQDCARRQHQAKRQQRRSALATRHQEQKQFVSSNHAPYRRHLRELRQAEEDRLEQEDEEHIRQHIRQHHRLEEEELHLAQMLRDADAQQSPQLALPPPPAADYPQQPYPTAPPPPPSGQ